MSHKDKRSRLEKLLCILEGAEGDQPRFNPVSTCRFELLCAPAGSPSLILIRLRYADSRNDQTLRFAAQKIADVALQQPHHIPSVLRQVRCNICHLCVPPHCTDHTPTFVGVQVHLKLYSREWKARVYAGDVLADLAQRVEHCTVECLTVLPSDHNARRTRSNVLANFSLNAVLLSGATLVSGNQVRSQLCTT